MVQSYYVEPEYWIEDYAVGDQTSAAAQINITSDTGHFGFGTLALGIA